MASSLRFLFVVKVHTLLFLRPLSNAEVPLGLFEDPLTLAFWIHLQCNRWVVGRSRRHQGVCHHWLPLLQRRRHRCLESRRRMYHHQDRRLQSLRWFSFQDHMQVQPPLARWWFAQLSSQRFRLRLLLLDAERHWSTLALWWPHGQLIRQDNLRRLSWVHQESSLRLLVACIRYHEHQS